MLFRMLFIIFVLPFTAQDEFNCDNRLINVICIFMKYNNSNNKRIYTALICPLVAPGALHNAKN